MGGLKEKLRAALRPWLRLESEADPKIPSFGAADEPEKQGRISDWSAGALLRRLTKLRSACLGRHSYSGPKELALSRMLSQASTQGPVLVVVLPVSPAYRHEFLSPDVLLEFEQALAAQRLHPPGVSWVRLDLEAQLQSNEYFWDVVHMNTAGQKLATDIFLDRINNSR
jgi:hypothetical protein